MKESKISLGAGIGLLAGIIIGSVTDNVGLGIALGLCFGAGIGSTLEKKTKWKNYYSYFKTTYCTLQGHFLFYSFNIFFKLMVISIFF